MAKATTLWQPRFSYTPAILRSLMEIEAAKAVVAYTPLPLAAEKELRDRARIRATHYSTSIEGNRLTLAEAKGIINGERTVGKEKQRDVSEVRNYWNALIWVEEQAHDRAPLTENLIGKIHATVTKGLKRKPSAYRGGQNVIRDSMSGAIVYLPPEAADIPVLMASMVDWFDQATKEGLPVPVIAGLVHYQFVTIHPFYDGNGRTARLLATFILQRGGYGLNGYFSLEEHHAQDLPGYYRALVTHPNHNYYTGRAEVDLTSWLEYFLRITAAVFTEVRDQALSLAERGADLEPNAVRSLDKRARVVLGLFVDRATIGAKDVASSLGLSERMARELVRGWVAQGWLTPESDARKNRRYGLSAEYRQYIGSLSAI